MSISLAQRAVRIRRGIIIMLAAAQSGHSAGSLGMTDVFTALYFNILKHDPRKPQWSERDRVLLSNGHICPVLYATLAEAGYFPRQELFSLRKLDSRLQGHPHVGSLPGVENTSGPLAQGLSQACGLSLALRMDANPARVYALLSDGEQQEGQTWEAYLFAAKEQLHNLTVLIDRNHIQIDGRTEDIMPLDPLATKIESFNWQVLNIDGHDMGAIQLACEEAVAETQKPTAIICNTTPGKGVSFMEGKYQWHGKPPSPEEAEQALAELRESENNPESTHE
ncbi:MAG: transketolase [Patescibacteria group bacterium]